MDCSVSTLLDDLDARSLLKKTLVVMAGEFSRTPKILFLPKHYKKPGRDHWGAVQTVSFVGGGVKGGNVIGSSDCWAVILSAIPRSRRTWVLAFMKHWESP